VAHKRRPNVVLGRELLDGSIQLSKSVASLPELLDIGFAVTTPFADQIRPLETQIGT
jgi:hypothetical protein